MTKEEYIKSQKEERAKILQNVLESKASKKIIVAGPGTGKTYTFSKVLEHNPDGRNLAMTFIRLLRNDMEYSLGSYAEVRTFHEFCKKILHEKRGGFILYPKLTRIIEEDALHLKVDCEKFDDKFQQLDENGHEIGFYLKRGDYYNAVSFNDSVYRMLKELQKNPEIIPDFDQILIDEFQDFNLLEVSFINELEKRGNILIVGDDDQAVYDSRFSTPEYLREKFFSGKYEKFELPFCSRCTKVIVNTTNKIIEAAKVNGNLNGRISKRFENFIELKDADNKKYPKITIAHLTNILTVIKFIKTEIAGIAKEEIDESWVENKEYPTVLIVGAKQYLNPIFKSLKNKFENITFKQSEKSELSICDGYEFLSHDINSNLGWRILIDFLLKNDKIQSIIEKTIDGTEIIELLPDSFVAYQKKIVAIIAKLNKKDEDIGLLISELNKLIDIDLLEKIKERFILTKEEEIIYNKTQPSILLTSYQGCKGLSAGFVFIVGANNDIMPKDTSNITDVEINQFIVALTRTRKKCFILSEDWMYSPKDKYGNWIPKKERSIFIDWIPVKYLENMGHLKSAQIK